MTELSVNEMQAIDGGLIPALIIGAVILFWPTPAY